MQSSIVPEPGVARGVEKLFLFDKDGKQGWFARFARLSADQVARRVARCFVGISQKEMWEYKLVTAGAIGKAISAMVMDWAREGFRGAASVEREIADIHTVVLAWLLPAGGTAARESPDMWALVACCGAARGLYRMYKFGRRRRALAVAARVLPPRVQASVLRGVFGEPWRAFVARLFDAAWAPARVPHEACCYVIVAVGSPIWYVGKANLVRTRNGLRRSGWAARLREHCIATARREHVQAHRDRYRAWRCLPAAATLCIPALWGSEQDIFGVESAVIHMLQPPTQQCRAELQRARVQRTRRWPKRRGVPSLERELQLNVCRVIRASPWMVQRGVWSWCTYRTLAEWVRVHWQWEAATLQQWLYRAGWELALVLYLAQNNARLSYRKVWAWRAPVQRLLRVWFLASKVDIPRQITVRRKIERFLASTGLLPTSSVLIRVPSNDREVVRRVKWVVRHIIDHAREQCYPEFAFFLREKIKIVGARVRSTADVLSDQIQAARDFDFDVVNDMSQDMRSFYEKAGCCVASASCRCPVKNTDPCRVQGGRRPGCSVLRALQTAGVPWFGV